MRAEQNVCPICHTQSRLIGNADFLVAKGKVMPTKVFSCRGCGCYFREKVDEELIKPHFDWASYSQSAVLEKYTKDRMSFFSECLGILFGYQKRYNLGPEKKGKTRVLDIGCGFGSFIELMQAKCGCECVGIERAQHLREILNEKGIENVANLDETNGTFDIVTFLDSFYCFSNPNEILAQVLGKLENNGIIFMRVTNRNHLLAVYKVLYQDEQVNIPGLVFGDLFVAYSKRLLVKLFQQFPLADIEFFPERGKRRQADIKKRLYYVSAYYLSKLTAARAIYSPGLFAIATKSKT